MDSDSIVADVHTNPNERQILHVGEGKINVFFFAAETCIVPTIFFGSVSSYYERVEGGMKSLNDNEWDEFVRYRSMSLLWWINSFLLYDN